MKNLNHFINTVAELREIDKLQVRHLMKGNTYEALKTAEKMLATEKKIDKMLHEHFAERVKKEIVE